MTYRYKKPESLLLGRSILKSQKHLEALVQAQKDHDALFKAPPKVPEHRAEAIEKAKHQRRQKATW